MSFFSTCRLSCVNISKQGSRTTLVSTMGSSSLRENISCVFGPKQVSTSLKANEKICVMNFSLEKIK